MDQRPINGRDRLPQSAFRRPRPAPTPRNRTLRPCDFTRDLLLESSHLTGARVGHTAKDEHLSGTRMDLIERDTELATLHALFAEALDGRGKVAVISGSVGSGKTALFRFFTDEATTPETRLLAATAIRAERKHPLGVVLNLFRDLAPAQFHEEEFRATAATRLTRQILDELCRTLLEYATHTPLIIGIDDVHHA